MSDLKILRVHNRYRFPGGEETVFEAESALLRQHGHEVVQISVNNDSIPTLSSCAQKIKLAAQTVWSPQGRAIVQDAIETHSPDIVHFDNTFPILSPSVYGAARSYRIPVIQTLHNYRLVCPNGLLYRDQNHCTDCVGKFLPFPALKHACYRGSRVETAPVVAMLTINRLLSTWRRNIDVFIAPSDFAKRQLVDGGLTSSTITVKPHFVDYVSFDNQSGQRDGFLYAGRLSPEKGIEVLIRSLAFHTESVRIAGGGPLRSSVEQVSARVSHVRTLGFLGKSALLSQMARAIAVVVPSLFYETFGVTVIEAFFTGTPVIASNHGPLANIITDGQNGLLFSAGNHQELAKKMQWASAHPDEMRRMGENARREYESKYTPERNYELLMDIYQQAIEHARRRHA